MSIDATTPDIPEKSWTNPFGNGTPLHDLYERRVKHESDLVVVVSDYHNRRGTGKTVLSLKLAAGMDRTDEGLTKGKVSLSPQEVREAYAEQPLGSALVLDEAEAGISNRSAMTNVNKAMREIMSMGRVEQKYLILNAPASSHIDKSVRELADVWMVVQRRGRALVHFLEYNPYGNQPLSKKVQNFEWSDIETGTELNEVYKYLTKEKRKRIGGEEGGGYIERSEHEDAVEKAVKKAKKEKRNELIRSIYNESDIDASQNQLADAVGISQSSVGNIVNQ